MFTPRPSQGAAAEDPLTRALNGLIPPNESPAEREQRLALEANARMISDAIDEKLKIERQERRNKKIVKILLLGQSESGKSTTLKVLQLYYAPQSLRQEAFAWRTVIHLNLLRSIQLVMDALSQANRENAPSFTDDLRRLLIKLSPLKQAEELLRMRISPPQEEGDSQLVLPEASEFSVRSASGWKQAFNKMRGNSSSKDDIRFDTGPASILEACSEDMTALWTSPAARQILKQRRIRLEESSGFFLDDIDRIAKKDYEPTDEDILRARLRTVGVQEHKISLELGPEKGQDWYIYDVGGSRSQRSAWESFFDDVNAIIFLAPLSSFDQSLAEDKRVNRVEDSLLLWKSICSSKLLAKVELILFLNKCDILAKKLESGIRLAKFVPSFKDHPNNVETVTKYFRAKFKAIQKEYSPSPRMFYGHLTSVVDARSTALIVANVHEVIVKANLHSANVL
ncbi:probable G protein alpha chain [Serendipita indica DSM 11827]|uniref:Probable G protein alpha chain n=1 Tax=Serendipita indica (strain DSM 11827) TaxID=1109443 RepID=G4TPH3_SERID|nr:probable G protein alpha chain [Serendipita indica DSM 11827]